MKITVKTHQYAVILACVYIGLFAFTLVLNMAETYISGPLGTLNSLAIQIIYISLFAYLGLLLAASDQPRAAVTSFWLYCAINILGIPTMFIQDLVQLRAYSLILGVISLAVYIFLIVKVFRLKHPIIAKYYRILAIMLGALALLRIASPFALNYIGEYFSMSLYSLGRYYTAIFSLLIPVTIIILLKRTTPLVSGYVEPAPAEEEYL
ncbi:hypothetical protein [Mucilaginibacter pedocola]|uniref:Uncharacterized protein n=1 Tax=Mucilaginibacter pedocola TaxID=1792845 RepID=A0A1S9PJE6_9SPHI|nr:hypothetical protein [Mucilaginibacter pedocola]OOQ61066.1 hypothetical protein BC343_21700 [Mucilaginibacter pedocola]